jgi:hypothetical protein
MASTIRSLADPVGSAGDADGSNQTAALTPRPALLVTGLADGAPVGEPQELPSVWAVAVHGDVIVTAAGADLMPVNQRSRHQGHGKVAFMQPEAAASTPGPASPAHCPIAAAGSTLGDPAWRVTLAFNHQESGVIRKGGAAHMDLGAVMNVRATERPFFRRSIVSRSMNSRFNFL